MALSVGRMVPTFLFIIPQFKVSDTALYQKEIPSNLRSRRVPKVPKPPMLKENLSEHSCRKNETRSHLINAPTSWKRRDLQYETVETQPNHHFPPVPVVQVLWHSCHEIIYEISSSHLLLKCN